MAPSRRPRLWDRFISNFPPFHPPQTISLMCHTSGKMIGRRGLPDEPTVARRWISWAAALIAALGVVLLLSKLAWGDPPLRRNLPSKSVGAL